MISEAQKAAEAEAPTGHRGWSVKGIIRAPRLLKGIYKGHYRVYGSYKGPL